MSARHAGFIFHIDFKNTHKMRTAATQVIRDAEASLFASGKIASLELMDRVIARMAASWRAHPYARCFPAQKTRCLIYAGRGNNAGDAIGLAAALGMRLTIRYASDTQHLARDSALQLARAAELAGELPELEADEHLLIIDGLLGSGTTGELRPHYAELIDELNAMRLRYPSSLCLAIDIPSGLHPETGVPSSSCVRADITLPIGCIKSGMLADSATGYVGRLMPIALPELELPQGAADVVEHQHLGSWIKPRAYESYKNKMGHLHIIAGSKGYIGAAQLCAESALRTGAGLVTLHCSVDISPILSSRVAAEVMVRSYESMADIETAQADALLIGPGLGQPSASDRKALHHLILSTHCPLILDADALNMVAAEGWQLPEHSIITPHPGEMRRLAGDPLGDRVAWAQQLLHSYSGVLLLKGARTLICSQSSQTLYYNSTGGPFMSNGGQGDVLAGCIAALAASGMPCMAAAAAGAYLCGLAAEHARASQGMSPAITASQTSAFIPRSMGL